MHLVLFLLDSLSFVVEIVLAVVLQCFTGIAFLDLLVIMTRSLLGIGESIEYIPIELVLQHFAIKDELTLFAHHWREHLLLLTLL